MTIGEKIIRLRTFNKMSQEELADRLGVSRQSVSKWEMNQALPQIDKIRMICDLFGISADSLVRDNIELRLGDETTNQISDAKAEGNKYFGTDGFRGTANKNLTADHAFKVGRFLGWYYQSAISGARQLNQRPRIVIGKDTRRSSYMLEYALVAGITASGADVYMLHVTTTPSVSYVTKNDEFDCGIMITASHNPFYDNGIKVLNRYGEKLDDRTASLIEAYIDGEMEKIGLSTDDIPLAEGENIGCVIDYVAGRNRYVGYLISLASHSYKSMRVGLDCANGASWMIAGSVFNALGAQTYLIGANPDGVNVNQNCGSTHIENLCKFVKENHLDVGFAFDGDADRCIAVDEKGNVVDGDKIIYIFAMRLKARGALDNDTVVTTIMSNSGLTKALKKAGIKNEQTAVGDRFVYERMLEGNFRLGGEQSGHIIMRKYATTGDGILTAIMLAEEMRENKATLSELAAPVVLFPQKLKNYKVTSKDAVMADKDVLAVVDKINDELCGNGRIILRKSGTEPLIRVMAECEDESACDAYIDRVAERMAEKGLLI